MSPGQRLEWARKSMVENDDVSRTVVKKFFEDLTLEEMAKMPLDESWELTRSRLDMEDPSSEAAVRNFFSILKIELTNYNTVVSNLFFVEQCFGKKNPACPSAVYESFQKLLKLGFFHDIVYTKAYEIAEKCIGKEDEGYQLVVTEFFSKITRNGCTQ